MEITLNNDQEKFKLPQGVEKLLEQCVQLACSKESLPDNCAVSVTIVDDQFIRELNRDYRGIDTPTDVLSFSLLEETGEEPEIIWEGDEETLLLGDIIISAEAAARQAEEYGHSVIREFCFLAVHGVLHLLGYDHETAETEQIMEARQQEVLSELNLSR